MSTSFNSRTLAVYGTGFSFIVMAVSGLATLIAPQGRLAESINWRLAGLSRSGWEAVHNATAFAFMGFAIWHIVLHWSVIRNFLIGTPGHKATHRPEALVLAVFVLLIVATAILDWPPASWVVDLNEYFKKEFWGKPL
jgi:ABC-type Fe3+-siderophore transport system permease subunit